MKKLFYLLVLISYSTIGFSQNDSMFTIEGQVFDKVNNSSIENAKVILMIEEEAIDTIITNETGKFHFETLEKGDYWYLKFEADSFRIASCSKLYFCDSCGIFNRKFHLSKAKTSVLHEKKITPYLTRYNFQDEKGNSINNVKIKVTTINHWKLDSYSVSTYKAINNFIVIPSLNMYSYILTFEHDNFKIEEYISHARDRSIIFPVSKSEYNSLIEKRQENGFDTEVNIILKKKKI